METITTNLKQLTEQYDYQLFSEVEEYNGNYISVNKMNIVIDDVTLELTLPDEYTLGECSFTSGDIQVVTGETIGSVLNKLVLQN